MQGADGQVAAVRHCVGSAGPDLLAVQPPGQDGSGSGSGGLADDLLATPGVEGVVRGCYLHFERSDWG